MTVFELMTCIDRWRGAYHTMRDQRNMARRELATLRTLQRQEAPMTDSPDPLTAEDLAAIRWYWQQTGRVPADHIPMLFDHIAHQQAQLDQQAAALAAQAARLADMQDDVMVRLHDDFVDDLADALGLDPNAWDTDGADELAHQAIITAIKDLQPERRVTQLVTAALNFEEYAEHIHDCPISLNQERVCDCGLEELHQTAKVYRAALEGRDTTEPGVPE